MYKFESKYSLKKGVGPKVVLSTELGSGTIDFKEWTAEDVDAFVAKYPTQKLFALKVASGKASS